MSTISTKMFNKWLERKFWNEEEWVNSLMEEKQSKKRRKTRAPRATTTHTCWASGLQICMIWQAPSPSGLLKILDVDRCPSKKLRNKSESFTTEGLGNRAQVHCTPHQTPYFLYLHLQTLRTPAWTIHSFVFRTSELKKELMRKG